MSKGGFTIGVYGALTKLGLAEGNANEIADMLAINATAAINKSLFIDRCL